MKKQKSIKTGLLIIVIVGLILGMAGTGIRAVMTIEKNMKAQLGELGLSVAAEVLDNVHNTMVSESIINKMLDDDLQLGLNSAEFMLTSVTQAVEEQTSDVGEEGLDESKQAVENERTNENESGLGINEYAKIFGLVEVNVYTLDLENIASNIPKNVGTVLSSDHAIGQMIKSNQTQIIEDISQSIDDNKYYKYAAIRIDDYIIQIGKNTDTLVEMRKNMDIQSLIEDVASKDEIVYALLLDETGRAVAHSESEKVGTKYTDDNTLKAINGEMVQGYYERPETGETVYDVQQPIIDESGKLVGIVNLGLSTDNMEAAIKSVVTGTLIETVIFVAVLSLILVFVITKMLKPLASAEITMKKIADGDFTDKIPEKHLKRTDELGRMMHSLNEMQGMLSTMVGKVREQSSILNESSEALSSSTHEATASSTSIAEATDQIAKMSTHQADEIAKIAEQTHELGSEIKETSSHIEESFTLTRKALNLGEEGQSIVKELVKSNDTSNEKQKEVTAVIQEVNKSVGDAEQIIEIINRIAKQINMLALNASIESARAGEAGRGFAVVADEIRVLSDETSKATNQIEDIIQNMQLYTGQAVTNIEVMASLVGSTNASIETTSGLFDQTSDLIETLGECLKNVQSQAQLIDRNKDEIIGAVDNISSTVQESSASTEEVSASIEEQVAVIEEVEAHADQAKSMAASLDEMMSRFKL
jgi:methyl-accepting chemotaxis protein